MPAYGICGSFRRGYASHGVLMSCTYAAMQVSPTHLCLTLACEHFKTDFGALVKRTLPVIGIFYVILTGYYLLLNLFF